MIFADFRGKHYTKRGKNAIMNFIVEVPTMEKFSDRLITLRKERGLTQEDMAKLIHKKRSTISGYETADKEPDFDTRCV